MSQHRNNSVNVLSQRLGPGGLVMVSSESLRPDARTQCAQEVRMALARVRLVVRASRFLTRRGGGWQHREPGLLKTDLPFLVGFPTPSAPLPVPSLPPAFPARAPSPRHPSCSLLRAGGCAKRAPAHTLPPKPLCLPLLALGAGWQPGK